MTSSTPADQPDEPGQPGYGRPYTGPYTPPGHQAPQQPPQQPYGQQYGYGQPSAWGQQQWGQQWKPPDHPQATLALVLGLVGLIGTFVLCVPVLACPFAWVIGRRAVREIDAQPQAFGGRGNAQAGMVLGIIGTVLLVLALVAVVGLVVLGFATSTGGGTSGTRV